MKTPKLTEAQHEALEYVQRCTDAGHIGACATSGGKFLPQRTADVLARHGMIQRPDFMSGENAGYGYTHRRGQFNKCWHITGAGRAALRGGK